MTPAKSLASPRRTAPRGLSWLVGALSLVIAIELTISRLQPNVADRNNFFEYRLGHDEQPERVLVEDKFTLFAADDPTILQVGDSSGFLGVMPPVVESVLPGARYLNMSVFANLGYRGHYEMARAILRRNPNVKALVLYFAPVGFQPNKAMVSAKDLLGDDIWREFGSPLHAAFHLPSLGLRQQVTSLAYEGRTTSREERDRRALRRYPEAKALIPQSGGWQREHDNTEDRATGVIDNMRVANLLPASMSDQQVLSTASAHYGELPETFDWMRLRYVSMAEQVFDQFRDLAQAHGARLIIASAPVSEIFRNLPAGARFAETQRALDAYAAKRPDVGIVPLAYLPDDHFSSPMHVATPYTTANSLRFAHALKSALGGVDPVRTGAPAPRPAIDEMTAAAITGYGFSPSVEGPQPYRTLRNGRDEGLIFLRAKDGASRVQIDLLPDTPASVSQSLGLAVYGAPAQRESEETTPAGLRRITWRLPAAAMQYGGWLELLVSTRGAHAWMGDELRADATGPQLKISAIRFGAD